MSRLILIAMLALIGPSLAVAQTACPKGNLLTKKRLKSQVSVRYVSRLNDNVMPGEGGPWNGAYSAILSGAASDIVYDLGAITQIKALAIQGDNNDTYDISISSDGTNYTKIWTVPIHPKPGMRLRLQQGLTAEGRFLRLHNPIGDSSYSIGELQAFCTMPAVWPPPIDIKAIAAKKDGKAARRHRMAGKKMAVATLGFACFLLLIALRRETKQEWVKWAAAGTALALALFLGGAVWHEFKRMGPRPVVLATIFTGLGVAWFAWVSWLIAKGKPWRTWLERGALLIIVFSGGMSWGNYGTFHGSKAIHYWDTFHYYVGGKYFQENEYHLLYHCSAIAELDDGRKREFKDRQVRDLRNNALGPATKVLEAPEECREKFTPERWAAFQQDLRLFRSFMGKDWWGKMFKDHGFNATPVWTLAGRTVTNIGWKDIPPPEALVNSPKNLKGASADKRRKVRAQFAKDKVAFEQRIGWLNLTDGLFYAASFALIWWAFGLWGCAFAILIWGVGYPWAYFWTGGGFGRVPWFFMAVAGACFLKRGHSLLGGAAITWSMLLRVFPGALIAGVSLKIAHGVIAQKTISKSHLRLIIGCTLALAVLVPLSLPVVGGTKAYSDFIGNSLKHKGTPLTNHMGLPTLLGYHPQAVGRKTRNNKLDDPFLNWKKKRVQLQSDRKWFQGVCVLLFLGLIWYAGRRLDDWEVTALSTIMITGIFELTCYYYSYLVLLALLSMKRQIYMIAMWVMVIGGHLIHIGVGWYDEQYTAESALALGIQLFVLVGLALEAYWADKAEKQSSTSSDDDDAKGSVDAETGAEPGVPSASIT